MLVPAQFHRQAINAMIQLYCVRHPLGKRWYKHYLKYQSVYGLGGIIRKVQ